jgi:hypothetical protein
MQDEVDDGRALPIGQLFRVATNGRADDGKNAAADDCTDAQRRERDGAECLFKRGFRTLGLVDELVDGFSGENLSRQGSVSRLNLRWSQV